MWLLWHSAVVFLHCLGFPGAAGALRHALEGHPDDVVVPTTGGSLWQRRLRGLLETSPDVRAAVVQSLQQLPHGTVDAVCRDTVELHPESGIDAYLTFHKLDALSLRGTRSHDGVYDVVVTAVKRYDFQQWTGLGLSSPLRFIVGCINNLAYVDRGRTLHPYTITVQAFLNGVCA